MTARNVVCSNEIWRDVQQHKRHLFAVDGRCFKFWQHHFSESVHFTYHDCSFFPYFGNTIQFSIRHNRLSLPSQAHIIPPQQQAMRPKPPSPTRRIMNFHRTPVPFSVTTVLFYWNFQPARGPLLHQGVTRALYKKATLIEIQQPLLGRTLYAITFKVHSLCLKLLRVSFQNIFSIFRMP